MWKEELGWGEGGGVRRGERRGKQLRRKTMTNEDGGGGCILGKRTMRREKQLRRSTIVVDRMWSKKLSIDTTLVQGHTPAACQGRLSLYILP